MGPIIGIIGSVLLTTPATAMDRIDLCIGIETESTSSQKRFTPDQRIEACTALINALKGNLKGEAGAIPYQYRGDAYFEKKDYNRAIIDYDKAIKLNPKKSQPYYGRGKAKKMKGDASAELDFAAAREIEKAEIAEREKFMNIFSNSPVKR